METPEETKRPLIMGTTTIPNKSSEFFRAWLEVMRPLHNLASKEMDFAAALLSKRYELAKNIKEDRLIDRTLFSVETKKEVASSLDISYSYMQYILKKMRECGMLQGKSFSPTFLPPFREGEVARWLFIFKNEP